MTSGNHRNLRRGAVMASALLAWLCIGSDARSAPTPTAPATSTGSYSVTYTRCSSCTSDWIEERVNGGAWTPLGSGSQSFSAKPSGRYDYRVGYAYLQGYFEYWIDYSASVTVVVTSQTVPRPSLETQMTFEYRVRRGDIDFDGRSDLFVHRTRGGAAGDGTIDALVLRQLAGGVLAPRAVSAAERLSAAAWPEAGATIALRDVNVDGFVDVILGRVSSALGVSGVPAQIVYAPGAASGITRGIRRVDSAFGRFGRDIVAYVKDAEHFSANAPIRTSTHTYIDYVCNYNYLDPNDWMYSWYNNCYPILVTVYVTYPDYSAFSSDAVDIWTHERSIEQGSISARTGLGRIEAEIEDVLNVDVAEWDVRELIGEALPDADQRHGTELFLAILGIATAHAQEQGAASSPPDVVEVRGRRVMGFGPIHTALRYGATTVSGYDNDPRALTDGLLVSQVNWPPDRPLLTMPLGTVSGGPPALYWARVLAADANYDDDLRYDALPSIGRGGYNSNGYANGLIRATNGVPSIRMEDFVGGEVPVPASEFN